MNVYGLWLIHLFAEVRFLNAVIIFSFVVNLGIRYMAPEVGLNQPYNIKADVYSWTMVFWYILMLEPPFGSYTPNMFVDRIFQKGHRPMIDTKWSKKIHKILKFGWHPDLNQRPTFKDIKAELREQILAVDSNMGTILTDSDAISVATTMTDF